MLIKLIFAGDDKNARKDIVFFVSYPCLVLQGFYLTVDPRLMSSCAYLLTVCH